MAKKWVIPDIHGYSRTLQALIEDQIRPSRNDILIFLGDYIDRGPDSKGVIDYILELTDDDYTVRTLKGNHEDYLLRTFKSEAGDFSVLGLGLRNRLKKEWFKYGGRETLRSFRVSEVGNIPKKYIEWMQGLEYYIVMDSFILVHAGLNFELEDPFIDRHSMLWIRDFKVDLIKSGNRKVIHGHIPVSLEFIDQLKNSNGYNYIDLDNGIYMPDKPGFGNLVALELNSMELKIQPNVDLD